MPQKRIYKNSKSTVKKNVTAKRPDQQKKPEASPAQETIDDKKSFKFEFDEFIIENAPEHIKMFAKPDANLQGEKRFQIKITKDKTGKAQFDIVFIKLPEGKIGDIHEISEPSDKDKYKSIVISPDDHKIDFVNTHSSSTSLPRERLSSFSIVQRSVLPTNTADYSQNVFQSPYERSYANNNDINRYDNIRTQLVYEKGGYPNYPRQNSVPHHVFPNPSNVQPNHRHLVNAEYMPDDYFNSFEALEPSVPPKTVIKEFPLSQLKSDAKSPFVMEDSDGRQYLVKPISNDKDPEEPSTSKYVPNGESKIKMNKKSNPIMRRETYIQKDDIEFHPDLKNIVTESPDTFENDKNSENLNEPKETMHTSHSKNQKYTSSPNFRNANHSRSIVMTTMDESKVATNETNGTSLSSSVTIGSIPSECNFVIESACQRIQPDKQKMGKVVFAEILDYFKNDLIKSLIGQKISEEREFIVKHMNHKGKFGLEKKEFIQKELKERATLFENENTLIETITAKIKEINDRIMELLDHKIYNENSHLTLIVEQQLEKSKDLIVRETCTECFTAIKYCTARILQENLRSENKFIKKEVEINLNKELEITLEKIKSNLPQKTVT